MKAAPGLGQMMAWTVIGVVMGAMAAYKTTADAEQAEKAEDDEDKLEDERRS